MKRLVVVLLILWPAVAWADLATWQADSIDARRSKIAASASAGFTSASSIANETLQAVGRVVLKRATRAAWADLSSRLKKLARCDDAAAKLPKTCEALGVARIEEIVSSPKTLLDAFVSDVLGTLGAGAVSPEISEFISRWQRAGLSGAVTGVKSLVFQQLHEAAAAGTCPAQPQAAAFWVIAQCLFENDGQNGPPLLVCNVDDYVSTCNAADRAAIRDVVVMTAEVLSSSVDKSNVPSASVTLVFEWAKLAPGSNQELLEHVETVFSGLVSRDSIRTVQGLGGLARQSNAACPKKDECSISTKLLGLMGAIGEFVETFQSSKTDPEESAKAREKIIEDLATSMVSRTGREGGAVVSLGGSLGLFGGLRFDQGADNSQIAVPVRLALGVGLQTYSTHDVGFHLSIEAFDLGQYVTYSDDDLTVDSPEVESALIAGLSAGVWFGNRELPWFVAAHATMSPFVRSQDDRPTFEVGVLAGLYVPLFDFN